MIRLSPQMRTAIQRTTLPILVLLSGAIVTQLIARVVPRDGPRA